MPTTNPGKQTTSNAASVSSSLPAHHHPARDSSCQCGLGMSPGQADVASTSTRSQDHDVVVPYNAPASTSLTAPSLLATAGMSRLEKRMQPTLRAAMRALDGSEWTRWRYTSALVALLTLSATALVTSAGTVGEPGTPSEIAALGGISVLCSGLSVLAAAYLLCRSVSGKLEASLRRLHELDGFVPDLRRFMFSHIPSATGTGTSTGTVQPLETEAMALRYERRFRSIMEGRMETLETMEVSPRAAAETLTRCDCKVTAVASASETGKTVSTMPGC